MDAKEKEMFDHQVKEGYVEKEVCPRCGRPVLTEKGATVLSEMIQCDNQFDAGEFHNGDEAWDDFCSGPGDAENGIPDCSFYTGECSVDGDSWDYRQQQM